MPSMPTNASEVIQLAIVLSVFGLVLAIWLIGVFWWSNKRRSRINRVQERLGLREEVDSDTKVLRLWKDGEEATTLVAASKNSTLGERMEQLRRDAGWTAPLQSVLLTAFGITILVFVAAYMLTQGVVPALGIAFTLPFLFLAYTNARISKRSNIFENQFVEALELAARSLRAGHPLVGSFRLIAEEMPAPVRTIFQEICQLQGLGVSLKDALRSQAAVSRSADMKLFATSVVIQLQSGGNLADMMHRLAAVVRDRIKLRRRIGVLTAQTQLSKRILMVLPFVLLGGLTILNADYMAPLFTTQVGRYLLVVALMGILIGMWAMNKLSTLQY